MMSREDIRDLVLVAGVTVVALALRLWGIDFGLPYAESRPDELTLAGKALGYGTGDLNPHFFNYPSLYSYLLFLVYGIYAGLLTLAGAGHGIRDVMTQVVEKWEPLFILSRGISAVAGAITVPILCLLCRQAFSRWTALMAAVFLSVAYLHVRESHFGVTDVLMTAFATATVLFLLKILKSGSRCDYVIAGILAGLAASTKYNAALLAVPALAAHWLSPSMDGVSAWKRLIQANLWWMGGCMVAAFLVTSPFVVLDSQTFLRDFLFELRHLAGAGETIGERGWIHHVKMNLWYGTGPALLVMSLVGAVAAGRRDRRAAVVLLGFPLLYYAAMGRGYTVFARYAVPLVPFVCAFAAVAIGEFIYPGLNRWVGRRMALLATGALTVLVAATPLCRSLAWDRLLCREDTRAQAVRYTEAHVPMGSRLGWVGTQYGCPRFPDSPESLDRQLEQVRRQGRPGRLLAARAETARRRGSGYDVEKLDARSLAMRENLPSHLWVEYYPLAYSLKATEGADAVLAARGFRRVVEMAGASREALNEPTVRYDLQDSLYTPYAGFRGVACPGPTLTLWTRVAGDPRTE